MAIGKRIRFFRKRSGMTMKYLGVQVGFPEETADIRIAQYESEKRVPKDELTEKLASCMGVSSSAIKIPNIDDSMGIMHTLFALEDFYGLSVELGACGPVIAIDDGLKGSRRGRQVVQPYIEEWAEKKRQLRDNEISQNEYDEWRYHFYVEKPFCPMETLVPWDPFSETSDT